jgi:hypothetical protein
MDQKKDKQKEPARERVMVLQGLPPDVTKALTREEVQAILFEDEWPDSLQKKLAAYLE